MVKVFVDADGCPVVNITVEVCKENSIDVILVCDTAHNFTSDYAKVITVDKGADSADLVLVNMVSKGDIVITQDYGLAAMCLARNCICISQNGMIYDENNIDELLLSRHIAKKIRRSGGKLKGPHKRTSKQDSEFKSVLTDIINKIKKEGLK